MIGQEKIMKALLWLIPLFLVSCSYVSQFQEAPAGEESPLAGIISEDIALPAGEPKAQQGQAREDHQAPPEGDGSGR